MNCDECQEQVFELIERESVDPQAVREVLDRCPECRALFAQMKAALADVAALPSEEPPSEIDVAILRAARERMPKAAPPRHKWFQPTQWAVAAAALLAIGVGVWAIPKGEEVAMEQAEPGMEEVEMDEVAVDEVPVEQVAMEGADAPEIATSPAAKSIASPAARKRRAGSPGLANVDTDSAEDASASGARAEPQQPSRECARRLAAVERRAREGRAKPTTPEDALAIGRCYQAVGNVTEARRWLKRAASHPDTKERAARALSELPTE